MDKKKLPPSLPKTNKHTSRIRYIAVPARSFRLTHEQRDKLRRCVPRSSDRTADELIEAVEGHIDRYLSHQSPQVYKAHTAHGYKVRDVRRAATRLQSALKTVVDILNVRSLLLLHPDDDGAYQHIAFHAFELAGMAPDEAARFVTCAIALCDVPLSDLVPTRREGRLSNQDARNFASGLAFEWEYYLGTPPARSRNTRFYRFAKICFALSGERRVDIYHLLRTKGTKKKATVSP
ncbi:MAG: hypothetical protein ACYDBH_13205 [Acidobacteriaceae bacterium]